MQCGESAWCGGAVKLQARESFEQCAQRDGGTGRLAPGDRAPSANSCGDWTTGQFQDANPIVRDTGGYVEVNDTRLPAKQGLGPMVVCGLDLCP